MGRCGTSDTHCCWLGRGGECRFVQRSAQTGFRWQCSLRVKYGSWDEVHRSPEYLKHVKKWLLAAGYSIGCGDWPPEGVKCNDCGEVGHG